MNQQPVQPRRTNRILLWTAIIGIAAWLGATFWMFSGVDYFDRGRVEFVNVEPELVGKRVWSDIHLPEGAFAVYLLRQGVREPQVFLRFSAPREVLQPWLKTVLKTGRFQEQPLVPKRFYGSPDWFATESIEKGTRYLFKRSGEREEIYIDEEKQTVYYLHTLS